MEELNVKRDEIGIVPSSVELLINAAIKDLVSAGVDGNEVLDIIIKKHNNVGVPFETLLKLLSDYCKDDFNKSEFLTDIYSTELDEAFQITDDYYSGAVTDIRDEYFTKKGNFSKFEKFYNIIEDDIENIDKQINNFEIEQDKLPDAYDDEDNIIDEQSAAKFDELDNKISLYDDRKSKLDNCCSDISDYMDYSNEEMKELELAVYGYINSKILSVQILNENDFYSLFSKMISNKRWFDAPGSLQYEIMKKIVEFAKSKGVQVDFNKFLEMNENTNSKKI